MSIYKVGQIVKIKSGIFSNEEKVGKIVATRTDKPDTFLVTWFEQQECWTPAEKIIEVCPIETLKEAAKNTPAIEELLKHDKKMRFQIDES